MTTVVVPLCTAHMHDAAIVKAINRYCSSMRPSLTVTIFVCLVGACRIEAFVFNAAPTSHFVASTEQQLCCLSVEAAGPKAAGRRRPSRRSGADSNAIGPKPASRPPRQRPKEVTLFDGKTLTSVQTPNESASPLDLKSMLTSSNPPIRSMIPGDLLFNDEVEYPAFQFFSLDDLFGAHLGFSEKFNSDSRFRHELRMAIRQDIFSTTPFYANLSKKAARVLLLPDSSLEGSWLMPDTMDRMTRTTIMLRAGLGEKAPTGDEFFQAIGKLCGSKPSTHWIDIVGVQDRKISHSWHLDFGKSPENSRTVLLGFPPEDNYLGCGVFSHIVPLKQECMAPKYYPRMEPVLFDGSVDEDYVVRPLYKAGRELISYRDIDVLHSAPDATYRTSVMRFM